MASPSGTGEFSFLFSLFTWRLPTNNLVHPLKLKSQAVFAWGLNERQRWRLSQITPDIETCCIQPGVVSFQPDIGQQIRGPLHTIALACTLASVLSCLCTQPACCLQTHRISDHLSTSWSALQCSRAPIKTGLVPFASVLEVMWSALQGQHHRYTHISGDILPVPAALHCNPGEIIIMTSAHSRGKRQFNFLCPLFLFFLSDSIFCGLTLPSFSTSQRKTASPMHLQAGLKAVCFNKVSRVSFPEVTLLRTIELFITATTSLNRAGTIYFCINSTVSQHLGPDFICVKIPKILQFHDIITFSCPS